jgi:hypothetical protein
MEGAASVCNGLVFYRLIRIARAVSLAKLDVCDPSALSIASRFGGSNNSGMMP